MRAPASLAVGDTRAVRTVGPLSQTDLVRFAGAGGDFNPLHHDPDFAGRAGFPRIIAMGQFQAGILAGWVSDWLGVEHLLAFDVRFIAPLMVGDTLTVSGTVTSVEATPSGAVATIELLAVNDTDTVVATGTARAQAQPR